MSPRLRAPVSTIAPARAAIVVGAALALAGCPPDLSEFEILRDGAPARDGGPGGGDGGSAGDDAAVPGPCPLPHALVSVESFDGEPGRVLRLPLDGAGATCAPLSGRRQLPSQPMAVAWLPAGQVAAATRDGLYVIDPGTDDVAWAAPSTELPVDAFAIAAPEGEAVAVAFWDPGTVDHLRSVVLYRGGLEIHALARDTAPALAGSLFSVTADPRDASRFLALRPDQYSAAVTDPISGAVASASPYVPARSDAWLRSVHALRVGTTSRLAWTGRRQPDDAEGVYYLNDTTGASGALPLGPIRCQTRTCTYAHAVADPTLNTRWIALCGEDGATTVRDVVRFTSTGDSSCEVLFEGASLGPQTRLSRLAVATAP